MIIDKVTPVYKENIAQNIISKYFKFHKNCTKITRGIAYIKRTAIFHDELIYKPNIGYKYFESLRNFNKQCKI